MRTVSTGSGISLSLAEETLQSCPVCAGTESVLVFTHADAYMVTSKLTIYRCTRCSMIYLNPRLTLDATTIVENQSTVYDLSQAEVEQRLAALGDMVTVLSGHAPRRGRLLDIGCNRGLLLEAARRQGWTAIGVELSPVSAQRARNDFGLEVYGSLDAVKPDDGFDLIVAWHVLEHIHAPVSFLSEVASLLKPDGVLAVQVPSFDFVDEFVQRSMGSSIACAVHTSYFTEQNIRPLLARAGLDAHTLINSPDDLMLTVFCTRQPVQQDGALQQQPRNTVPLRRRAYDMLRERGPRSLLRESQQYLRWRWHLLTRR